MNRTNTQPQYNKSEEGSLMQSKPQSPSSAAEHASHQRFASLDNFESLTLKKFITSYYTGPWILVKDGSIKGYFDWVPIHLRVGAWHPLAIVFVFPLLYMVFALKPEPESDTNGNNSISQIDVASKFSVLWWINLSLMIWMIFIFKLLHENVGINKVIVTFTVQSWSINVSQFFLMTIAPFLNEDSLLNSLVTKALQFTRFTAISTALIVFFVWNFILMPLVACRFMKTSAERKKFLKFCFNFRMVNIHILNLPLAIASSIMSSPSLQKFNLGDLWCALTYNVSYLLFYILVLDRLGVHLYPIFSPRSILSIFMWSSGLGLIYASYQGCNSFIDYLSTLEMTKSCSTVFM